VNDIQDFTVLHEMAHLSGLLHEEHRRDYQRGQPAWCRSADDVGSQEMDTEKTYGTEFDPYSVTNYCSDDIAKGFAFYHLLCEFPRVSKALSKVDPEFLWDDIEPYCGFMMSRSYPVRLSLRDRAGLRRAYLGIPVPPGWRSYRTNPDELQAIEALNALYESLPDEMAFDPRFKRLSIH